MNSSSKRARRSHFPELRFQVKYAISVAIAAFMTGACAILTFYHVVQSLLRQLETFKEAPPSQFLDYIQRYAMQLSLIMVVQVLFFTLFATLIGVLIHKNVVGPVNAFVAKVRMLLQTRERAPFPMRKSDEFQVLKDLYKEIADTVAKN